jgi:hypothetical protein
VKLAGLWPSSIRPVLLHHGWSSFGPSHQAHLWSGQSLYFLPRSRLQLSCLSSGRCMQGREEKAQERDARALRHCREAVSLRSFLSSGALFGANIRDSDLIKARDEYP